MGGTRVVADIDLIPFERQIGTTGVMVDPDLYIAFGISGAVQHVNGLGTPDAVVAVNLDALPDDGDGRPGPGDRRRPPAGRGSRLGSASPCRAPRRSGSVPNSNGSHAVAFDAVVAGAGPAGASAALTLARAGRSVALIERGIFPGAKNMYGGVVYGRVLDDLVPNWWEDVPYVRWVSRRATMIMTPTQASPSTTAATTGSSRPTTG